MARLIDANALLKIYENWIPQLVGSEDAGDKQGVETCIAVLQDAPTIDAVEVVRCKDCVYYHKAHVLCPDGTEKDFSEFPHEEFAPFGFVSVKYGINVGGKCELEKNCGYEVDKSVYREPNDFCGRGERKDGYGNG